MSVTTEYLNKLGSLSTETLLLLQNKILRPTEFHNESKEESYYDFLPIDTQIFTAIEKHGILTMSQLAAIFGISNQRLTRPVNRLVNKGYLERIFDKNDRRVIKINVTPKLNEVAKKYNEEIDIFLSEGLAQLSDDERQELIESLKKISGILNKIQYNKNEGNQT